MDRFMVSNFLLEMESPKKIQATIILRYIIPGLFAKQGKGKQAGKNHADCYAAHTRFITNSEKLKFILSLLVTIQ